MSNEYRLDEVFCKLIEINRYVAPIDMKNIVGMIFDSFRTVYSPEKIEGDEDGVSVISDQSIDYKQDYSMIWDTFKAHRNIDLNKEDLSWIEFQHMLQGVLLECVGSLCRVLEFRSYEKPPDGKGAARQIEHKQHMQKMKLKALYRIRKSEQQEREELGIALHSIMDFMKGKCSC